MAMMFGHRWVSSYGEKDDGTWLAGLQDFKPSDLGKGLDRLKDEVREWPPTLSQFRDMCLKTSKKHQGAAYKFFTPYSKRLRNDASREHGRNAIKNMKDILK